MSLPGRQLEMLLNLPQTQRLLSFRSAPTKLDNGFKFVTGGDMGVSNVAKQITTQAAKTDPDFALLGGDLAYANGRSTKSLAQLAWTTGTNSPAPARHLIPIVIVIGNHEMGSGLTEEQARQLQTHPKSKFFYSLFTLPEGKPNSRWISAVTSASTP